MQPIELYGICSPTREELDILVSKNIDPSMFVNNVNRYIICVGDVYSRYDNIRKYFVPVYKTVQEFDFSAVIQEYNIPPTSSIIGYETQPNDTMLLHLETEEYDTYTVSIDMLPQFYNYFTEMWYVAKRYRLATIFDSDRIRDFMSKCSSFPSNMYWFGTLYESDKECLYQDENIKEVCENWLREHESGKIVYYDTNSYNQMLI